MPAANESSPAPRNSATLIDTLRRLGFLTAPQLDELARIQDQFPDPQALARELLQRGWITAAQVAQLLSTTEARTVSMTPRSQGDTDPQRSSSADPWRTVAPPSGPTGDVPAAVGELVPGGGGYRKIKRLGRGSFGEVWLAEAPGGVRVALKMITRPVDHEESQNELKALDLVCGLRHPFLLQNHSYWTVDEQLFIAMELADGSLRDRLKQCKSQGQAGIPLDELLPYTRQSAEALDFLHSKHVQHRDVKPENLLLVEKYIKLADFGLARSQGSREFASMTVGGTPVYMAPEVWTGKVSPHTDQYSLALTYAELRLGRRAIGGTDLVSLMHEHVGGRAKLDPLPPAEQEVLFRALAKEPGARYPSCLAFAEALEKACRPAPPPAPPAVEPEPRRSWLGVATFAGLALLVVAVFLWRGDLGGKQPTPAATPAALSCVPPPEWQPVGDARTQDREGRWFPARLARQVGGQRIEMILIPRLGAALKPNKPDVDSYYIMETKVTAGMFKAFAASHPTADKEWEKRAAEDKNDRLPVRGVCVTDAYQFAHWLGGQLPTIDQWDKAAGLYRSDKGEGPYRGKWDPEKKNLQIGVGRLDHPRRLEETRDDVSPFDCRDMAGNGFEWTRNLQGKNDLVPLDKPQGTEWVLLRGKSFTGSSPLTYADLAAGMTGAAPYLPGQRSTFPLDDKSFRIVLEPMFDATPPTSQVGSP